jgi:hypothetical protein
MGRRQRRLLFALRLPGGRAHSTAATCYRMRITRYICSTAPASLEPQSERLLLRLVKRRTPYRMRGKHRQSIQHLSSRFLTAGPNLRLCNTTLNVLTPIASPNQRLQPCDSTGFC